MVPNLYPADRGSRIITQNVGTLIPYYRQHILEELNSHCCENLMSLPFSIIYIFKVQVSVKLTKHIEGQDINVL